MLVAMLGLWLTLLLAGSTPVGRCLRHGLIEAPARKLARIERKAVITWLILITLGALLFWLMEEEGLRLFGMMMPEVAGWISMFEVASLVDAIAVAAMAASSLRLGAVRNWIGARLPAGRAKRARRTRTAARKPANDDDDGAGWAIAA